MAPRRVKERRDEPVAINEAMLPPVGPPAAGLEPHDLQDITAGLNLRKTGCQNLVQHPPLERFIAMNGRQQFRSNTQKINGNSVYGIEKAVHVQLTRQIGECLPVDPAPIMPDKKRPIREVPQTYFGRSEVHGRMTQQKQRIEIGRRQVQRGTVDHNDLTRKQGQLLQTSFDEPIGRAGMDVDEVIMVLDNNPVGNELGVVVLAVIDPNALLAKKQRIGLGLTTEKPDVNVTARTVGRNGVTEACGIPLKPHDRDVVGAIKGSKASENTPLVVIPLPDLLDSERPANTQRQRQTLPQSVGHAIPRDGRNTLIDAETIKPRPTLRIEVGECRKQVALLAGVKSCADQTQQQLLFTLHH